MCYVLFNMVLAVSFIVIIICITRLGLTILNSMIIRAIRVISRCVFVVGIRLRMLRIMLSAPSRVFVSVRGIRSISVSNVRSSRGGIMTPNMIIIRISLNNRMICIIFIRIITTMTIPNIVNAIFPIIVILNMHLAIISIASTPAGLTILFIIMITIMILLTVMDQIRILL